MPLSAALPLLVFAVLMAAAIWLDASARRLPNWLAGATLAGGVVATLASEGFATLGSHLAHALIVLVITMGIYAAGWFGAGDAKFYTAVASWFPLSKGFSLLMAISLSGLVLVLGWLLLRRIRRSAASGLEARKGTFPLGVPIAVGALVAMSAPLLAP